MENRLHFSTARGILIWHSIRREKYTIKGGFTTLYKWKGVRK